MRRRRLGALSDDEFVARFREIVAWEVRRRGIGPGEHSPKYRRTMAALEAELARREKVWLNAEPPERQRAKDVRRAILQAGLTAISEIAEPREDFPPPPERDAPDLTRMTVPQLVARFATLTIQEEEPEGPEDTEQLYWLIDAVERELEGRRRDQRRALLSLYSHPVLAVRYRAAQATQMIEPDRARSRLLACDDPFWSFEKDRDAPSVLKTLTVKQLVRRFLMLSLEQVNAELLSQNQKINRLTWLVDAITNELGRREGDERRALSPLLDHPKARVRLNAAMAMRSTAPESARAALQCIVDQEQYPEAAYARQGLKHMNEAATRHR